MAVLTAQQLAPLRRAIVRDGVEVTYSKPVINDVFQALEDWFEGERAEINTAINNATSPLTLTVDQKKWIVRQYLRQKSDREAE